MSDEIEKCLRIAHNAPEAVGIDTRDLETAVRQLVSFAWEMTGGAKEREDE